MFVKSDLEKAKERKIEEYYFNLVALELEKGIKHNPTWAKAISESKGDIEIAKSCYINYQVQSLKDDTLLQEEEYSQKEAKRIFEEKQQNEIRVRKQYHEREKRRKEAEKQNLNPYIAFLLFSVGIIGLKYLLT
ncbi:hypothetical protein JHD49_11050 [Sulfurimonas sp. SAG-AH-194-C21]|nr:hypothetical protein [Sulfurimonas sp. SAG-AH-194-C21]MDF1884478.1 hypothetical protein [Sulfurimonas sp. SAG-AH-194-C21]